MKFRRVLLFTCIVISFCLRGVIAQTVLPSTLGQQDYLYAFSEATRFYLFGNYVQAVTLYKECLRIKPNSSAVHYQLSKVFLDAGNVPLAREHAKKAVIFEPGNKWFIQQLGDIYQLEQKNDSAITIYRRLLDLEPGDVSIMFGISGLYQKIKDYNSALLYLDSIDSQIGISKEVLLARYKIYETQNITDRAIDFLKRAETLDENDFSIAGIIAEYYRKHNMPDSAVKFYKKIYPEYSSEPVVAFSYADFLLENQKKDSAEVVLLQVMNERSIDALSKAAFFYNVLRDEKQFMRTLPVLDTVSEVFYNSEKGDIRIASIYSDVQIRLRNYKKAASALKKISEKDPSNYAAAEQLVFALNVMGMPDSVLFYSGRAIQQFKNRPLLFLFNGSAHYQKGSYDNAINALNNGLSITQDSALKVEFYSLLAECYQNKQEYDKSEEAFNNALKIDSRNIIVKNNYAYYLSLREKNLKFAEKMSLETIKAEPKNATYLDTYAWILYKRGNFRKAEKIIQEAIENGGNDEDILKHGAEIKAKLRKYNDAIQYLNILLNQGDTKNADRIRKEIENFEVLKNKNSGK